MNDMSLQIGRDTGNADGDAGQHLVDCLATLVHSLTRDAGRIDRASLDAAQAALRAAQRSATSVRDLTNRLRALEATAQTDELTGVLNRRTFDAALASALASGRRYREGGVIAFIDLDGFKTVNDVHGHAAGDALLRHVGHLLSTQVRESDIVGRLGGDEFAVVLTRSPCREGISRALGIEATLNASLVPWQGHNLRIRASFGIHAFSPDDEAPAILAHADHAMFRSKRQRYEAAESAALPMPALRRSAPPT